jgi:hypothetical protein
VELSCGVIDGQGCAKGRARPCALKIARWKSQTRRLRIQSLTVSNSGLARRQGRATQMSAIGRTLMPACLVTILGVCAAAWGGQTSTIVDGALDSKIPHLDLADQTFSDGLGKLISEPIPLSFGLESVLKQKMTDPPLVDPRFDLHLEGASLREVLDALCRMDPRYTWSIDGDTINIYPRTIVGDSSYFLNRELTKLEIKGITDIQLGCWQSASSFRRQRNRLRSPRKASLQRSCHTPRSHGLPHSKT